MITSQNCMWPHFNSGALVFTNESNVVLSNIFLHLIVCHEPLYCFSPYCVPFGCLLPCATWFSLVCVLMIVWLQTPCWKSRFDANTCLDTLWFLVSEQPEVQLQVDTMNNKHVTSKYSVCLYFTCFWVLMFEFSFIYLNYMHVCLYLYYCSKV